WRPRCPSSSCLCSLSLRLCSLVSCRPTGSSSNSTTRSCSAARQWCLRAARRPRRRTAACALAARSTSRPPASRERLGRPRPSAASATSFFERETLRGLGASSTADPGSAA
ncbi:hypothetical protein T492DRAFT_1149770, partial [Pavlovales sp. CCMP2436]